MEPGGRTLNVLFLRPHDVLGFLVAQAAATFMAILLFAWLFDTNRRRGN